MKLTRSQLDRDDIADQADFGRATPRPEDVKFMVVSQTNSPPPLRQKRNNVSSHRDWILPGGSVSGGDFVKPDERHDRDFLSVQTSDLMDMGMRALFPALRASAFHPLRTFDPAAFDAQAS